MENGYTEMDTKYKSDLNQPQGKSNQDNSKNRVRNEMENGYTEMDTKYKSDLNEPQGKFKNAKW